MFSAVFHLIMFIHYTFIIYYEQNILNPPEEIRKHEKIGLGSLKFITFWDLLVQWLYFTVALLNDILHSNTPVSGQHRKCSQLQKCRDFIFTTIGFSTATFVCSAFWGLYALDRELIQPAAVFDSWFPTWFNQGTHTVPIFGVLVEMQLICHRFPSRKTGFLTVACFASSYLLWTLFIGYYWDFWVYAILKQLTGFGRFVFITVMAAFFALTYFVGESLHHTSWKVKTL
ncbi:unnamed protein product [Meganyctiphanes norvegica]|uniref:Androgen-dependent TFPI-regulating protein n=1 Tax=Meganyctiphanes norvegica TaxID=48144 RepID=A0AAV2PJM7_MEGNR